MFVGFPKKKDFVCFSIVNSIFIFFRFWGNFIQNFDIEKLKKKTL